MCSFAAISNFVLDLENTTKTVNHVHTDSSHNECSNLLHVLIFCCYIIMLTNNASDIIKPFQLLLDNYLYTNGAS